MVAVTHIGYNTKQEGKQTDVDLARNSRDIDIIIGGHSHTLVTPGSEGKYPSVIPNADGRPVIITQTGKTGAYIADVQIDFNGVKKGERVPASAISYKLIPVTDRFPAEQLDKKMMAWLAPYKHVVDSINAHTVAYAPNACMEAVSANMPIGQPIWRFIPCSSSSIQYTKLTRNPRYRQMWI